MVYKLTPLKNLGLFIFLSELLPLIFCIYFRKKINTKYLKVFFIYAILLAFFSISGILVYAIFKSKLMYQIVLSFYVLSECICFCMFFYFLFKNGLAKKLVFYSIFPIAIFWGFNFLFYTKENFNNHTLILEFIFFIIVITYYFYEKMRIVTSYSLYKSISFWLCTGFFLYFTGNFFFLIFSNSTKDSAFLKQIKIIYAIITISKDLILAFAWFATERIETNADIIKIPDGLGLDDDLPFLKQTNS